MLDLLQQCGVVRYDVEKYHKTAVLSTALPSFKYHTQVTARSHLVPKM